MYQYVCVRGGMAFCSIDSFKMLCLVSMSVLNKTDVKLITLWMTSGPAKFLVKLGCWEKCS